MSEGITSRGIFSVSRLDVVWSGRQLDKLITEPTQVITDVAFSVNLRSLITLILSTVTRPVPAQTNSRLRSHLTRLDRPSDPSL